MNRPQTRYLCDPKVNAKNRFNELYSYLRLDIDSLRPEYNTNTHSGNQEYITAMWIYLFDKGLYVLPIGTSDNMRLRVMDDDGYIEIRSPDLYTYYRKIW